MSTATIASASMDPLRAAYQTRMELVRARFAADGDGEEACRARCSAVDDLLVALWNRQRTVVAEAATERLCLVALGGYGRRQLFPFSDIDLLFLAEKSAGPAEKEFIRSLAQTLWDFGLKVATSTRALAECGPVKASDPEGSLAFLDLRFLAGVPEVFRALQRRVLERRSPRDTKALITALAELTRARHRRFGNTLFHLEPNVKDAPGGLRDVHVCHWLSNLRGEATSIPEEFAEAVRFLAATRVFLHLRHGRDDNTLDWHAQDEAAAQGIGLGPERPSAASAGADPALWMRFYFRKSRAIERQLLRQMEVSGETSQVPRSALRAKPPSHASFTLKNGVLDLKAPQPSFDPARDPELVLEAFAAMAATGVTLGPTSEERIADAVPVLSANLEDGPRLWTSFRPVLTGVFGAAALREMHALGLLELILPEFHGIDALVIRDAYHRYTVDEHTFVLIHVLHSLAGELPSGAPEWIHRFSHTLRDLPHPELLFLAALLHDTGKGRAAENHAIASAHLAHTVCSRLELGTHESELVVRLIELHLEMSAALRRDIFDTETVRVFAEKVGTHDLLRMLTLFTYADISAVHPDALTPWKAENLWRLSMAAANQLDRSVDQDRLDTHHAGGPSAIDFLLRAMGRNAPSRDALECFLDGFPERYLRTRSPETIREHLSIALSSASPIQLGRRGALEELTVISRDRPHLFAEITAVLAGWGMDVLTAEAFSNAAGLVVDTFSFQDTYRTLEFNPEERDRLRAELERVLLGTLPAAAVTRRRGSLPTARREIVTRIEFDSGVSMHSTLLQIVTRDVPGLLHTAAQALSDFGCSVEVALIDTEGEVAIDVFYLTQSGAKLDQTGMEVLRIQLLEAIGRNARQ